MLVVVIGSADRRDCSSMLARGLEREGAEVEIVDEREMYKETAPLAKNRYMHRLFWRFLAWPLQSRLIEKITHIKPDVVLVIKGWLIRPSTIKEIKKKIPGVKIVCFNTDNPFNTWSHGITNDWIIKSIPLYDAYMIWAKFLIKPLKKLGAKNISYLPFGYSRDEHYQIKVSGEEKKKYFSEISFVGSWDKDRERWLEPLLDYDLKIWGNAWEKAGEKVKDRWQGYPAYGGEFSKICNSSKICLNLNRKQTKTGNIMRMFEIPACGGFMLSERTPEAKTFFEEGKEADYFSSPEEMLEKVNLYLKNDTLREKIAAAGHTRIKKSGYSYEDRAKALINIFKEL